MDTADKRPPDPAPERRHAPQRHGKDAEIARGQELLETRYMADLGPVDPSWGRRQFLFLSSVATGFAGLNFFVWPFIDSLNPAADVQALAATDVDLAPIEEGQSVTVVWRGKPIFIRHRTEAEIAAAKAGDGANLPDPASDAERAPKPQWLVVVGVCNHLGCVPRGQRPTDPRGEYQGWFCPCHGSHFDTSGRIRKGPAPNNLEIPDYAFLDDHRIRIG